MELGLGDDAGSVMVNRVVRVSSENQMDDGDSQFDPSSFDISQVFSMIFGQSHGPVNWDGARATANELSLHDPDDGTARPDPPVDQARADYLEAIVRAAQTNVAAVTGLTEAAAVPVHCVTRLGWTTVTLDGLRPVLEALATRIAATFGSTPLQTPDFSDDTAIEDPEIMAQMMSSVMTMMLPQLFGSLAGSLAGHLAHHALGQYDLPLPIAAPPQLAFVISNMEQFASDWEVPFDELTFALAARESVHSAQRSVPWVRERLVRLCSEYVAGFEMRVEAFEQQIPLDFDMDQFANDDGDIDPMAMLAKMQSGEIQPFAIDPAQLLSGMQSESQQPVLAELQRFSALLGAHADVVVSTINPRPTANIQRIDEALKRHRVERGSATSFVELMLGLQLDRSHYEAGAAFCAGVVDRSGIEGLNRLWEREAHMPTASEFEAPGLWLARLELDLE